MADLITHSLSFTKESLTEFILKPLFVENDIRDIITVRTDIQGSEKLDFIDTLSKITKAYQSGTSFTSSTGVTVTQKTITVVKMKAEVQQRGSTFFAWVKEHALAKGFAWDDITGTIFEQIVSDVFMRALKVDLQRQIFLGDVLKEIGVTGVLDEDYKEYDGLWARIIADFASVTIPAAQRITLNNASVKQVDTATLTGTAGTATIAVNGIDYLATFATDLTTTATNFVTSHAATILAREHGIVVTNSTTTIIFTAGVEGRPQTIGNPTNVTTNLAGSTAATTPNTLPSALTADEAFDSMVLMEDAMPAEMLEFRSELRILCTRTWESNYRATLESDGTEQAHSEILNGKRVLTFRGIPLIVRHDWDIHLAADFVGYYPHRALLTIPKNLIFATDFADADSMAEEFYDKTLQKNFFRVQYKAGTQYVHTNYLVAAY